MVQRGVVPFILVIVSLVSVGWPGSPEIVHYLPQVGAGGGIQSVILVLNEGEEEGSLLLEFFQGTGTPLDVTIGQATASTFDLKVPAGGTARFVVTSSAPNPAVGWAQLQSSAPVSVQLLFEVTSAGKLVTQAAVESAVTTKEARLFVDTELGSTGLALANISPLGPIWVRLIFKDETGEVLGMVDKEITARGHFAKFVSELFPEAERTKGSLEIGATGGIVLITLQQTGLVLGTLPVIIPNS